MAHVTALAAPRGATVQRQLERGTCNHTWRMAEGIPSKLTWICRFPLPAAVVGRRTHITSPLLALLPGRVCSPMPQATGPRVSRLGKSKGEQTVFYTPSVA